MSFWNDYFPNGYTPNEALAETLALLKTSLLHLGDPSVHCPNEEKCELPVILPTTEDRVAQRKLAAETLSTAKLTEATVTEEKSAITVKFITDVTVRDYSVYSTKGIKRDYYGYQLEDDKKLKNNETATQLIDAVNKDGYLQVTKIWRFKNTSAATYEGGSITPELKINQQDTPNNAILIDQTTTIPTVAANTQFDVSIPIQIPSIPGTYKQSFRLNDKDGNRVIAKGGDNNGKTFYLTIRVVPDEISPPVLGPLESGTATEGRNTGKATYLNKDMMYFCNWGPYYWDRNAAVIPERTPDADTHQHHDRHAWDINAKDNIEAAKPVYAISQGKVIKMNKTWGALWIRHDYIEGQEHTTGYVAVYMHMLKESWPETPKDPAVPTIPSAWNVGASVYAGEMLGKIGGRGRSKKIT